MKAPWISVVVFLAASLLGAAGQFLYKAGTDRAVAAGGGLLSFVANGRILAGVVCYVLVMVCFVAGFRAGGSPTVLYPVYASTFLWAALIGRALNGTPITPVHMVGMVLIIAGVSLMGS
jgi:multidrug transporter EmrE-like cation transporter